MAVAVVKATPWWLLSLAFHALVFACLPLFLFSYRLVDETGDRPIKVAIAPRTAVKLDLGDRPRSVIERAGFSVDEDVLKAEPRIFFPSADRSDHDESREPELEDHRTMHGAARDALSWLPGNEGGIKGRRPGSGIGASDSIGVGLGSGGARRYGTRLGGRRDLVARGGGSDATESAVEAGLRWLARHQAKDGRWSAAGFEQDCPRSECTGPGFEYYDVGVTSLALLAFLGAGHTPANRSAYRDPVTGEVARFGETVKKGLKWLVSQQKENGELGAPCQKALYNHVLATYALSEAYGLTNAVLYRAPAQRAVDYLEEAQNRGRGWQYQPQSGFSDTSVTGFCVLALKSAMVSGLTVREDAFSGARAFLLSVTDPRSGIAGYFTTQRLKVVFHGNERWLDHPTCTAVAMLSRMYLDRDRSAKAFEKAAQALSADLPRWDSEDSRPSTDFYYWYAGSLALFQYDGPDGTRWRSWNEAMSRELCAHQRTRRDGCLDGSWDSFGVDRWGVPGGRVYGTALNVLTLEVYYRFASLFGGEAPK